MQKYFEEAMQHIAGTCMMNPEQSLNETLKCHGERKATQEEVDAFEIFLEDNECWECEECGWYCHPGEESQGTCSDCTEYSE